MSAALPPDDPTRSLTHVHPDDPGLRRVGLVGNTYTVLISGDQTNGRYALIDMFVRPQQGPPPHRHDFEEMFSVVEGEIVVTFRDRTMTLRPGDTVNIPANAPHAFRNESNTPARLLCLCSPPGQEEYFQMIGVPVAGRTEAPPNADEAQQAALKKKAGDLAPSYRTEFL